MPTWTPEDLSPLQTEHAAALRVPFLRSGNPSWHFVTGIVVDPDNRMHPSQSPTEDEVAAVADYLEAYCRRCYSTGNLRTMREFAPYDLDAGANAGYFMKRPDGGWSYRRKTWEIGPYWMPSREEGPVPLSKILNELSGSW